MGWLDKGGRDKSDTNKGIQIGLTNTKVHLKGHMETYYSRSLLKYIHTEKKFKWSHQITEEIKLQLNIYCHQVPRMSFIQLSWWPKSPMETTKSLRLIPRLLVIPHKLIVRPYCWRKHLHSPWTQSLASMWLRPSLLLTVVHGTGRYVHTTRGET